MKKQFITIKELEELELSDQALFIIDANVSHDYLMKPAEVKQSDLDYWRKDRKYLCKTNLYKFEMIKKLNAIRLMQLVTDYINHCFSDFDYNTETKVYCLSLWHDDDCKVYDADGEELIDVLYDLFKQTNKYLTLHFNDDVK